MSRVALENPKTWMWMDVVNTRASKCRSHHRGGQQEVKQAHSVRLVSETWMKKKVKIFRFCQFNYLWLLPMYIMYIDRQEPTEGFTSTHVTLLLSTCCGPSVGNSVSPTRPPLAATVVHVLSH